MAASDPPWLVSSFRFRARVGFFIPSFLSGQRGVTPAFGYGAPHPSAGGTLTLLSNALLSARYELSRPPFDGFLKTLEQRGCFASKTNSRKLSLAYSTTIL